MLINIISMSVEKYNHIEASLHKALDTEGLRDRLPKEYFDRLLRSRKFITFRKGDTMFDDGDNAKGVYIIEKGIAKLSKSGVYGKDQILRFIKEGDLVGYRSLLCHEAFQAKAEAMTSVETYFIPAETFLLILEHDSKLAYAMLQKIAYELGESSNTITLLAQKTVRERLAEILLLLEDRLGTDPEGYIKIALTREEIANLIGTATESAIRLISEFKADRLIEVEGRNIKVLDRSKLMKLGHCN